MKIIVVIVWSLVLASQAPARDLHLIDGKVFTNIRITGFEGGELRFLHDGGLGSVKISSLTQADVRELSVTAPAPVIAGSLGTTTAPQAVEPSYLTRNYSNRSYTVRNYGDRYSAPSQEKDSEPQYKYAPSTYTPGVVHVRGYTRKDGTYVRPHTRRK